jgi:hypothetical protein
MRKNKKLLLIVIVAILAVSGVVAAVLLHGGQEPSNGGSSNTTPDEHEGPVTPSTLTMLSITDGNVFVMKAGTDSWIEAQVGMSLEAGDIVKSGNSSSAQITFFDGSTIELKAGTEIEVVSLGISDTGSKTIKLKQAIGSTISRVVKLVDSASSYEVETPACVAAVRGSIMKLDVIEGGVTWVTNFEGNIWVIANGVELKIPQGRKCIITPGQPPQLVTERSSGGGGGGGGFITDLDIAVTKASNVTQAHEGDNVTYTYTVTNPGNVPLSDVSVTDDKIEEVTYRSGDTNENGLLDTDETWIFAANYTVSGDDPSPLVNTAAAAGTYAGQTIIAWATASVSIIGIETASISVEVESGPEAPIYIWDSTTGDWAIDQSTGEAVDGSNHATNSTIAVPGDHSYCVWVEDEYFYHLSTYPEGWEVSQYPIPGHEVEAACGYAYAGELYSVGFFVTASIQVQITGSEPPTASIFIWDYTLEQWATDEYTGWAVNGTNHSTPSIIEVAGGHSYYVWVDAGEGWYGYPTEYPDGWEVIYYLDFLELEVAAAYGYAAPDNLYSLNFTLPY